MPKTSLGGVPSMNKNLISINSCVLCAAKSTSPASKDW